jgi:hypothetical protein
MAPRSLEEAGLTESDVEALILKCLLNARTASGTDLAQQVALPFNVLEKHLGQMKQNRLVVYKSISTLHDYMYELTEQGTAEGRRCSVQCAYFGAAPLNLKDYSAAVAAQSIHHLKAKPADVRRAFSYLTLSDAMLQRVGRAVCSRKGLFLYGAPGHGKICIAERITKAYGLSMPATCSTKSKSFAITCGGVPCCAADERRSSRQQRASACGPQRRRGRAACRQACRPERGSGRKAGTQV